VVAERVVVRRPQLLVQCGIERHQLKAVRRGSLHWCVQRSLHVEEVAGLLEAESTQHGDRALVGALRTGPNLTRKLRKRPGVLRTGGFDSPLHQCTADTAPPPLRVHSALHPDPVHVDDRRTRVELGVADHLVAGPHAERGLLGVEVRIRQLLEQISGVVVLAVLVDPLAGGEQIGPRVDVVRGDRPGDQPLWPAHWNCSQSQRTANG